MAKREKNKSPKRRNRHMNVMVVPHGGGRNRNWFVHGFVLIFLVIASAGVLTAAALMVSDYWKNIIKPGVGIFFLYELGNDVGFSCISFLRYYIISLRFGSGYIFPNMV